MRTLKSNWYIAISHVLTYWIALIAFAISFTFLIFILFMSLDRETVLLIFSVNNAFGLLILFLIVFILEILIIRASTSSLMKKHSVSDISRTTKLSVLFYVITLTVFYIYYFINLRSEENNEILFTIISSITSFFINVGIFYYFSGRFFRKYDLEKTNNQQ
jgi:hypothetical protein